MPLLAPILTAADPLESSEGSVDPFAMQAAYERLAERIFPSVTVRMNRIRFLTAMCVSAHVCQDARFLDRYATDGVSPPWMVFEWYLLEAHVRLGDEFSPADRAGFAGWTKVRRALDAKRAVCAASYLKTPTVFGVHGIYRRLATALRLVTDDLLLDEGGYELLAVWEREQELPGFLSGKDTVGSRFREQLRTGIETGLERGATDRPDYWTPWKELPRYLRPSALGGAEAKFLYERMLRTDIASASTNALALERRRQMILHLRDHGLVQERGDEPRLVRQLVKRGASAELRLWLDAIDAYEGLCRPVMDAFNLLLFMSAAAGGAPISPGEYAAHPVARRLPERFTAACQRVQGTLPLLEAEPQVQLLVDRYSGLRTPEQVLEACIENHEFAQRNKPPDGKRPWTERARGSAILARPQYRTRDVPAGDDQFVHEYRMPTVSRFLRDLRRGKR